MNEDFIEALALALISTAILACSVVVVMSQPKFTITDARCVPAQMIEWPKQ